MQHVQGLAHHSSRSSIQRRARLGNRQPLLRTRHLTRGSFDYRANGIQGQVFPASANGAQWMQQVPGYPRPVQPANGMPPNGPMPRVNASEFIDAGALPDWLRSLDAQARSGEIRATSPDSPANKSFPVYSVSGTNQTLAQQSDDAGPSFRHLTSLTHLPFRTGSHKTAMCPSSITFAQPRDGLRHLDNSKVRQTNRILPWRTRQALIPVQLIYHHARQCSDSA